MVLDRPVLIWQLQGLCDWPNFLGMDENRDFSKIAINDHKIN